MRCLLQAQQQQGRISAVLAACVGKARRAYRQQARARANIEHESFISRASAALPATQIVLCKHAPEGPALGAVTTCCQRLLPGCAH